MTTWASSRSHLLPNIIFSISVAVLYEEEEEEEEEKKKKEEEEENEEELLSYYYFIEIAQKIHPFKRLKHFKCQNEHA